MEGTNSSTCIYSGNSPERVHPGGRAEALSQHPTTELLVGVSSAQTEGKRARLAPEFNLAGVSRGCEGRVET